jgi:hypothetical protein
VPLFQLYSIIDIGKNLFVILYQWHWQKSVENIIIIYPDGSEFSIVHFYRQNINAKLLCPLNIHGSASVLYKPLYLPLFFSNVLDLILFGTNKGYCSCSPCHHFHKSICHFISMTLAKLFFEFHINYIDIDCMYYVYDKYLTVYHFWNFQGSPDLTNRRSSWNRVHLTRIWFSNFFRRFFELFWRTASSKVTGSTTWSLVTFDWYFFLNYTLAGFDLTTQESTGGDDTIIPSIFNLFRNNSAYMPR